MVGEILNERYKIISLLGEGGIGQVYLAHDKHSGQKVAIKVLGRQWSSDHEALERFKREADTLLKLNHPNIVKFIDAFEDKSQYSIVMEYISGGNLQNLLKAGALSIERTRQIALGICDALIRSHQLNIIHRDIKPENILIDEEGNPKLADFGVARLNEDKRMTRSGTKVGTPYYMSPEAWEGKSLDAQADVWSLGVVVFEMLTGKVPFDGDTPLVVLNKVNNTAVPDIKKLRKDAPTSLIHIINRMLTRDKRKRYKTMREVAVDLERNQDKGKAYQPTRIIPPTPSSSSRVKNIFKLVGIALIGLSFFLFGKNYLVQSLSFAPTSAPQSSSPDSNSPTATIPAQLSTATLQVTPTIIATETSLPATSAPTFDINLGSTLLSEKDGMASILIPAGEFTMGSNVDYPDEKPSHLVNLSDYWIDQTEVTNGMYAKCVADKACALPSSITSSTRTSYYDNKEFENYPVIYVSWDDANAYCTWAGRRLPTEAEWEKAARGTDRRRYPWGDLPPDLNFLNYRSNVGDTTPVGSYPAGISVYGILDMAGNVGEWVNDWYLAEYYAIAPSSNPTGPTSGDYKILRGGSWDNYFYGIRVGFRHRLPPSETNFSNGFRCAVSP